MTRVGNYAAGLRRVELNLDIRSDIQRALRRGRRAYIARAEQCSSLHPVTPAVRKWLEGE